MTGRRRTTGRGRAAPRGSGVRLAMVLGPARALDAPREAMVLGLRRGIARTARGRSDAQRNRAAAQRLFPHVRARFTTVSHIGRKRPTLGTRGGVSWRRGYVLRGDRALFVRSREES